MKESNTLIACLFSFGALVDIVNAGCGGVIVAAFLCFFIALFNLD